MYTPTAAEEKLVKDINLQFSEMKKERQRWEDDWEEIADYIMPYDESAYENDNRGNRIATKIYDGTPTRALRLQADGMQGYTVSQAFPWFKLRTPNDRVNDDYNAKAWLQGIEEHFFTLFQSRSNFYSAMNAFFYRYGGYGWSNVHIEEDLATGKILFDVRTPWEVWIDQDRHGQTVSTFRKIKVTVRDAVAWFGKDKLSESTLNLYERSPLDKIDIIHAIFPRNDRDVYKENNLNMEFASVYIEDGQKYPLSVSGYRTNPTVTVKWHGLTFSPYAMGPGHMALVDVITLNQIAKDIMTASHKAVNPPMNIPEEMRGYEAIVPGGKNYYKTPQATVTPVQTGIQYPFGIDRLNDQRQRVNEHFLVEFFMMLASSDKPMTATEIIERQGEKAAVLGPPIAHLSEALDDIFDRIFAIEMEAGRIPPPPDIMLEMNPDIEIDYSGPLFQAQRKLFETQGITHGLQITETLVAQHPELSDNFDYDIMVRKLAESYGYPQEIIKPDAEVQKVRKARAAAAAQQQQMAQAQAMADMAGKLAPAAAQVEGGADVMGQIDRAAGGALGGV